MAGKDPDTMQRSETVPADGIAAARVEISMAVGELHISGGATGLMDADFIYDEELEPLVEHDASGRLGALSIKQASTNNVHATENAWTIRLNDRIPLDLQVNVASANATLALDSVTVASLDLDSASGDVSAGLGGDQPYASRVTVNSASGDVILRLNGRYRSLASLETKSASGALEVDLGGHWLRDLNAKIDSVSGGVIVTIPTNVGVAVQTATISGRLDLQTGESSRGGARGYVNDAWDASRVKLHLRVATISGGMTIREAGRAS